MGEVEPRKAFMKSAPLLYRRNICNHIQGRMDTFLSRKRVECFLTAPTGVRRRGILHYALILQVSTSCYPTRHNSFSRVNSYTFYG